MNHATLRDLQARRGYPCVSVLINTTPGMVMSADDRQRAVSLLANAGQRLIGDADDAVRQELIDALTDELQERSVETATAALGLFAMPGYHNSVRLGRAVSERVIIDDTFATRDLVADLNRTAVFRVVTVSDRGARVLIGDRQRLVEERDGTWPLERTEDIRGGAWPKEIAARMRAAHAERPLPTVMVGVDRIVRAVQRAGCPAVVGTVAGNHDRSGWVELHHLTWPVVSDWLRTDRQRALRALGDARSTRRFAGGIDEVWTLANEGRVDTVVVEDGYQLAVVVDEVNGLLRADDPTVPGVIDDIVDEVIEAVLRHGGTAVMVDDGDLVAHDRIAAVLRY